MNHTETILKEDGTIFSVVDYIDDLKLKLQIVTGEITQKLFYQNEFGGMTPIDELGCSDYRSFKEVDQLLKELVKKQMEVRIKEFNKSK